MEHDRYHRYQTMHTNNGFRYDLLIARCFIDLTKYTDNVEQQNQLLKFIKPFIQDYVAERDWISIDFELTQDYHIIQYINIEAYTLESLLDRLGTAKGYVDHLVINTINILGNKEENYK